MAEQHVIYSFTIQDADGNKTSAPFYYQFDDTTTTLAQLFSHGTALEAALADAIDGTILAGRMSIQITGSNQGAAAGSNVQETGLVKMGRIGSTNTYGLDIPALAQTIFEGMLIDLTDAFLTALLGLVLQGAGSLVGTDDLFAYELNVAQSGKKTFRKK